MSNEADLRDGPDLPIFGEHREVCAFLMGVLSQWPDETEFRWLDLACGELRVLDAVRHAVTSKQRERVHYVGYDRISPGSEALARLGACGFASQRLVAGELRDLRDTLGHDLGYHLVTLTNAVHEVAPSDMARLLWAAVQALDGDTSLFLAYDVEWLKQPELEPGGVTWSWEGIAQVVAALLKGRGVARQTDAVARWRHHSTTGWTVMFRRRDVTPEPQGMPNLLAGTEEAARAAMRKRLDECERFLTAYRESGRPTAVGATSGGLPEAEAAEIRQNLWLHYGLGRYAGWLGVRPTHAVPLPPDAGNGGE